MKTIAETRGGMNAKVWVPAGGASSAPIWQDPYAPDQQSQVDQLPPVWKIKPSWQRAVGCWSIRLWAAAVQQLGRWYPNSDTMWSKGAHAAQKQCVEECPVQSCHSLAEWDEVATTARTRPLERRQQDNTASVQWQLLGLDPEPKCLCLHAAYKHSLKGISVKTFSAMVLP